MLNRLFPRQIDNDYRGSRIAIWLLVPILLLKSAMGANSIFMTRFVASSADRIPIDSYGADAAQAVLAFFALWGLGQLVLGLNGAVVLIRYRAMIPFFYLLLLIEHAARRAILAAYPVARTGSGDFSIGLAINLMLLGILIAGFLLSLLGRWSDEKSRPAKPS